MNVGPPAMNIAFSSPGHYALEVQAAPVFFKVSTIRHSSELCRLSSSEVLARLGWGNGTDCGHANGNGSNALTRRAEEQQA